jgi:SAM-dependent methyltransferase
MQDPIQRHPTRAEQLDILTDIVAATVPKGGRVLDLGCGTGYLGHLLRAKRADIAFVGIDCKVDALREAEANVPGAMLVEGDLNALDDIALTGGHFDAIATVLTFHDLTDEGKQRVLAWAAERLKPAGLLLVMDRLRLTEPALFGAQQAIWARLERVYGSRMRTAPDFAAYEKDLGSDNRPAALADYFDWLRSLGLASACLHLHGNIAVLGAARA